MRILMTGSTAAQVAVKKDSQTFASLVNKALNAGGHDVTWIDPSVSLTKDYLAEYDSILVGIAPPNSTSAHRIYGALSVIKYAQELGRLRLMVDAPEPKKVWAGLRAVYNKPDELTKDFYSKRREYRKTADKDVTDRLNEAVKMLYTQQWPKTIFPVFPWVSSSSVSLQIPMTSSENLVGLSLDSILLSKNNETPIINNPNYWVADSINSKWTKGIEKTIKHRIDPLVASRWESVESTESRLTEAMGCLVSVYHQGNPWWSISLSKSLAKGIPVVTDWRLSSMLGPEWSVLAHAIEEMSQYERKELANTQRDLYMEATPSWENSVELTCNTLLRK